jgi:diguanylate cyclase (GGDEF)-like protein
VSTSSDRIPVADRTRTGSAHTYLVIQGILIAISQVVPRPLHDVIQFLVSGGAVGALIFGIVTGRARPALGWALVAGGVLSLIAVGITIFVLYGPQGPNITISTVVPAAVSALTYPLLAAGLAILSRQTPRRGPADVLDATMTALAAYLLLWTFVLEPAVDHNAGPLAGAVAFPIGILLVFAIAVKLVLSGGLRDPSTRLLLLGVAALLTADGLTLIPAVRTSTIRAGVLVTVLWLIYSAAMGGAGLYPTAVRRQRRDSSSSNDTSWRRMALFAVLALVTPIAWAGEFAHHGNSRLERVGVTVSVVTAAIFLLLLVTRLGLIARVAQRQAKQLTEANLEQVDLQRELAYRAVHDPLTGLPNRVVLAERMEAVLARATGHHAILLLDLDGFKDINDSLGHPTGDEMLVEIARRMREVTPPNATLTRLGGDEFAAFVEDTDLAGAMRLADAYLEALRRPYTIGGRELFLTTSIGLYLMESGDVAGRGITESGDVAGRGITATSADVALQSPRRRPRLRRRSAMRTSRSTRRRRPAGTG